MVFTAEVPGGVSELTASPFPIIWATGWVSPSTGDIQSHSDQGSNRLSLVAPAPAPTPAAPPPALPPSPTPAPSPAPAPALAPEPESEGGSGGSGTAPGGEEDFWSDTGADDGAPESEGGTAPPACSIALDKRHSFDACSTIATWDAPIQLFYSLSPSANGGAVVRGGIRAQGVGWAGWGFGSARMAPGTNTVIVKTDGNASTGV